MIRTAYRGRDIKVLKSRTPGCVKLVINGRIINNGWQGDDAQALDWFRQVIDRLDEHGPQCPADEYPHWWPTDTNTSTGSGR